MSIKAALSEAISVIMSYECDIRDCKNQFGIDLVKVGFCQGSVYKYALRYIEKRKLEPEVTEEWIEEKARELNIIIGRYMLRERNIFFSPTAFIRSLVEELPLQQLDKNDK